ncbi:MAG: hypothetical protein NTZ39_08875 [Methanoregula sp.]|nr:hypothetical protein [Methanoregula sp.]
MGDEFSQIGVVYKITITADNTVLGYAVTNDQVATLQANEMTPHYVSSSDKVQWGLLNPYMVMEKATNTTKSFTVDKIAPYVYVLDGRWMASDIKYNTTPAVNYEITITKIYNPVPTPNQGTS